MLEIMDGLTVQKFFSPFYSIARRRFRLSAHDVDVLLAQEAVARLSGHDLVFRCACHPAGCKEVMTQVRFKLRPRQAAAWVDEFNARRAARQFHPAGKDRP